VKRVLKTNVVSDKSECSGGEKLKPCENSATLIPTIFMIYSKHVYTALRTESSNLVSMEIPRPQEDEAGGAFKGSILFLGTFP
jgi:hypothetical protein